jgi:hypothetical protein
MHSPNMLQKLDIISETCVVIKYLEYDRLMKLTDFWDLTQCSINGIALPNYVVAIQNIISLYSVLWDLQISYGLMLANRQQGTI